MLSPANAFTACCQCRKSIVKEHADWLAGRDITSVQILARKSIAVGQGGLILTSASEGKAWGFVDTKLPTNVLANLDFHAVHSVRDNVWIAGRPGSVILHSGDGGATWSFQKTGQPLRCMAFFFPLAQHDDDNFTMRNWVVAISGKTPGGVQRST